MPAYLSRRKLAKYVADRLSRGDGTVLDEVASLLVVQKRQHESGMLARDIQAELVQRGIMTVTVETAHKLTDQIRQAIIKLLDYDGKVELNEVIKPELLGGIRIITPTQEVDASLLKKITDLKTRHV